MDAFMFNRELDCVRIYNIFYDVAITGRKSLSYYSVYTITQQYTYIIYILYNTTAKPYTRVHNYNT